ncbi:MAG: hypothetical protein ACRDQ9_07140 [Pseudonocardiaceae bacterium]
MTVQIAVRLDDSQTPVQQGAAFQVLIFPFRPQEEGFVYALFRRQDSGYWHGVAGGGEAGESPLQTAHQEAGMGDGVEFVLGSRATMPVVAMTGEFSRGPQVLVIPEYAFGLGVENASFVCRMHSVSPFERERTQTPSHSHLTHDRLVLPPVAAIAVDPPLGGAWV